MHNLDTTNRETRNSIHLKLRQKLVIDFLTNTTFSTNEAKQISGLIKYCKGFIRDASLREQSKIHEAVSIAINSQLIPLPESPEHIDQKIREALPFNIPIKRKSQTHAIVSALHCIYTFSQLLVAYFKQLQKLLSNP